MACFHTAHSWICLQNSTNVCTLCEASCGCFICFSPCFCHVCHSWWPYWYFLLFLAVSLLWYCNDSPLFTLNSPPPIPTIPIPPTAPQARYVQAKLSVHDRSLKVATVIESLEMEMELLCLTGVEDQLQTDVRPTLEILRNAGIKVRGVAGRQPHSSQ